MEPKIYSQKSANLQKKWQINGGRLVMFHRKELTTGLLTGLARENDNLKARCEEPSN
jgi:hypothetical protein